MHNPLYSSAEYAAFFSEAINTFNLVSTVPYKEPIKVKATYVGFIMCNTDGYISEIEFAFCEPVYSLEYITYRPKN